jgi:hypothetical protein
MPTHAVSSGGSSSAICARALGKRFDHGREQSLGRCHDGGQLGDGDDGVEQGAGVVEGDVLAHGSAEQ